VLVVLIDKSYVDLPDIREEIFEVHLAPLKKWKD
jgi:hypothetical protein